MELEECVAYMKYMEGSCQRLTYIRSSSKANSNQERPKAASISSSRQKIGTGFGGTVENETKETTIKL